jgi:omega-6 fatty acid desaturase (delta-12 desaturase)
MSTIADHPKKAEPIRWQPMVAKYAKPDTRRSLVMLANTLVPYFVLWGLMIWSVRVSYWITLVLSVLAAGFLNFTPYYRWKHDHAIHHATAGDLDQRGVGDVYTMTVQEYLASPWWRRAGYRIMRNPFFLFGIAPLAVFLLTQRIPVPWQGKRERASIWWTNLALVVEIGLLGWKTYLMIQLPIIWISSTLGIWLFYVQHNFLPSYWQRHDNWEFVKAGLQGSSFYKLPAILQWFSGNIGFHHIHHLSPKIPNYRLPQCHKENSLFQVQPLTIRSSFKSVSLRLYDEERRLMVGWEGLKFFKT